MARDRGTFHQRFRARGVARPRGRAHDGAVAAVACTGRCAFCLFHRDHRRVPHHHRRWLVVQLILQIIDSGLHAFLQRAQRVVLLFGLGGCGCRDRLHGGRRLKPQHFLTVQFKNVVNLNFFVQRCRGDFQNTTQIIQFRNGHVQLFHNGCHVGVLQAQHRGPGFYVTAPSRQSGHVSGGDGDLLFQHVVFGKITGLANFFVDDHNVGFGVAQILPQRFKIIGQFLQRHFVVLLLGGHHYVVGCSGSSRVGVVRYTGRSGSVDLGFLVIVANKGYRPPPGGARTRTAGPSVVPNGTREVVVAKTTPVMGRALGTRSIGGGRQRSTHERQSTFRRVGFHRHGHVRKQGRVGGVGKVRRFGHRGLVVAAVGATFDGVLFTRVLLFGRT